MRSRSIVPHDPLGPAQRFIDEGREAEAATWLEQHPSDEAAILHRQLTTSCAKRAYLNRDLAAAIGWLERGLALAPTAATLNFLRGLLHQNEAHYREAVACYRHCVAAQPQKEEYVCRLGHALILAGRPAEACAILESQPQSAEAQLNRGAALHGLGNPRAAVAAFETASRLKPDLPVVWQNLGGARDALGDFQSALAAYNRAVALQPASACVHQERGRVLMHLKRWPDAITSLGRSCQLEPQSRSARFELAYARMHLCDWTDFDRLPDHEARPATPVERTTVNPFTILTLSNAVPPTELREYATQRALRISATATPIPAPVRTRAPKRPLRIGYVSPDFGNHAVGNCLRSLFARHDRARISVHAFSLFPHDEDDFRATIRAGCDTWDDLDTLADRGAVEVIANREIDILVDLAGHTKSNRLNLFAWRPSPIQVAWLGYPGTTGAPYIDYLLADEHLIPAEEETAFTERIVRLPGCYLPTDDTYPIAPGGADRSANGLPSAGFVFCAFNNPYKIEPFIFGAWMEILRRTPGAVLWLRGGNPLVGENLHREAKARAIDPSRLIFDPRNLPRAEHLARHRAAGLYLDTHFYNAHSTAADALRAGLAVLTLPGRTFPSRVGLSLLSALDLASDLVATSRDDYIARAVRLASDPAALADLRTRLATAVAKPGGPFDTTAFARKLEDTYERLAGRS